LEVLGVKDVRPKEIFRLGKVVEGKRGGRPVIIKLESKLQKYSLLENTRRLKNQKKFEKVYVKPDLTYEERQNRKKKWLERLANSTVEPSEKNNEDNEVIVLEKSMTTDPEPTLSQTPPSQEDPEQPFRGTDLAKN